MWCDIGVDFYISCQYNGVVNFVPIFAGKKMDRQYCENVVYGG